MKEKVEEQKNRSLSAIFLALSTAHIDSKARLPKGQLRRTQKALFKNGVECGAGKAREWEKFQELIE